MYVRSIRFIDLVNIMHGKRQPCQRERSTNVVTRIYMPIYIRTEITQSISIRLEPEAA